MFIGGLASHLSSMGHHLIKYIETMDQESTTLAKRLLQHLLLWIIQKSFAYNSSCSNFASESVKQKPKTNTLCWYNHLSFAEACEPACRNQEFIRFWVHFSPLGSPVSQWGDPTFGSVSKGSQKACLSGATLCFTIRLERASLLPWAKPTLSGGAARSRDSSRSGEARRARLHR